MALSPLKITWRLGSPMVAGAHPLHLDALVAYAVVQESLEQLVHEPGDPRAQQTIRKLSEQPLPLGRDEREGKWVWQASAVLRAPGPVTHGMRHWTRKTNLYDHANRIEAGQLEGRYKLPLAPLSYSPKLDTLRGAFKQQFKFYPIDLVEHVEAWCIGDRERLEELLAPDRYVTHIGAKARMGHGKVADVRIEHDDAARERWVDRVMPWPQDGATMLCLATRPPYWAAENLGDAWVKPEVFG